MAICSRLEDLPLKKGQRALVRVDLNVPLRDGVVEDDLRITTALPTINWLRDRGAVVVIAGHLGRPKGVVDPQYSMAPVAARLRELLALRRAARTRGGRPTGRAAGRVVEPGRRRAAREPALRAGRDRERPRLRHQPRGARRRVRERGVRCLAPRARVDRRPAADPPARGRPAARTARSRCCRSCSPTTSAVRSSPSSVAPR